MKSATDYLWFNTNEHREFINITNKVEELVERSGIAEGFALVSAMHITAGVYVNDAEPGLISDIDDSKKLNPKKRESLYKKIKEKAIGWSIGIASAGEIDRINIRQASLRAMQRAVRKLKPQPDFLLVDGFTIPWLNIPQKGIVKGDCQSFSIAAASILAKVSRDKIMMDYHFLHPQYNLRRNKGYPTLEHREALKKNGASPLHRQSYRLFS